MRYIGCKKLLLNNIKEVIDRHVTNAEKFCDIFSGTATVARYFKQWYEVCSNDLLYFSYCLQKATIENPKKPIFYKLAKSDNIENPIEHFNSMQTSEMESLEHNKRFFQNNYSPKGGRMYFNDDNALRIDYARNKIEDWKDRKIISEYEYYYLLASLIEGIPYISNISGTYGAYHKTWDKRTFGTFQMMDLEVVENNKENKSYNRDGVDLLSDINGDILYIDPPYNERQYLPNYHILETAALYDNPEIKGVTGVRDYERKKSKFCSLKTAVAAFDDLLSRAKFKHIILSYNTDGIIPISEIERVMKKYGLAETFEINYFNYRRYKSKNTANDSILKEMLIYIQKEVQ